MFEILRAKLRKIERRTKQIHLFFMPRCSNFANLLAKSDGYRVEMPIGSFAPKLKLLGEHTDPKTIHGRDIEYAGIEFIPSKEFIKQGGKNREGYRKSEAQVGNSQMYDEKAMNEALRRCMKLGYATIPEFMIFSGLKRDSAKAYLDSLCKGDHPRLWKVRESRRWLYFPKQDTSKE